MGKVEVGELGEDVSADVAGSDYGNENRLGARHDLSLFIELTGDIGV